VPSPVGHALGGIAFGWAAAPRAGWRAAVVLAAVAVAPDLDLLVGDHRGISHSIGAAAIVGVVAAMLWSAFAPPALPPSRDALRRTGRRDAARWAAAVALAWTSHVALDWLSNDTRAPIGVMALWPFTQEYYKAPFEIFPPISRRYRVPQFWIHNAMAVLVELAILGPVAILAVRRSRRGRGARR
jgi:membrane-bound metal-dependent hydrolase YbcI (DUF457 family)